MFLTYVLQVHLDKHSYQRGKIHSKNKFLQQNFGPFPPRSLSFKSVFLIISQYVSPRLNPKGKAEAKQMIVLVLVLVLLQVSIIRVWALPM